MAKHIGFDFQSVFYFKFGARSLQQTLITHLTARLCVKRCGVQNHYTALTCFEYRSRYAIDIQRQHFGSGLQVVVTHEGVACTGVLQGAVHFEFTSRTGLCLLSLHSGCKASFVDT